MEKLCRTRQPRVIIWRMCIACWLNKAARNLIVRIIYCLSTATIEAIRNPNIMLLYIVCFFHYSYAINILVCLLTDNDRWRKQRVGGNKELNHYGCSMCRCWVIKE